MKLIDTRAAVGHVICHDLTQIIPGVVKDARFRKGHIVTEADIPVLLSMGKEHLYVYEKKPGMLHEDEAALRLAALCQGAHMRASSVKEGKIELFSEIDGLFLVDSERLLAVNLLPELMIATRHSGVVRAGDKLAGMRVIPLVIDEARLSAAQSAVGDTPLLTLLPWKRKTAGIIVTGSEVVSGLIPDGFEPVIREKLDAFGVHTEKSVLSGDDPARIAAAISEMRAQKLDLIICTGGMSVDPDDRTPAAIRASGADIVSYGAPVLPGAMFLLGYFPDGTPVLGLPGCVMYQKTTIFDLVLPRVLADVPIKRRALAALGEGGLCLSCEVCRYPVCPFGK